jgi:uncharacterized membrane protein (DUF485 family)
MALDKERFDALVRRRWRVSLTLTALMLLIYYGFVLILAFDKELLSGRVAGGTMTLWIPVGLAVILAACALTGVYVAWANFHLRPPGPRSQGRACGRSHERVHVHHRPAQPGLHLSSSCSRGHALITYRPPCARARGQYYTPAAA